MYLLYSLLLAIAAVLGSPFWLVQMLRKNKYREGLAERLGRISESLALTGANDNCIWVHAVSVGEVLAVTALIARLKGEYPGWRIVVSTTTRTGQSLAKARFGAENVFYFPLDLAFAIRPYLKHLRPRLVVLAETEFWPNFLYQCHASGARMVVVNARISDRSFPRYRRFSRLLRRVLENVDLFLAQSEEDRNRLMTIGADEHRVQVSGNLKFDVKAPPDLAIVQQIALAMQPNADVVVCGSTVDGEEELLVPAIKAVLRRAPATVFVLAPRHPERFPAVLQLLQTMHVTFWRRSAWKGEPLHGGVLLLDTIGELAAIYKIATLAFIGGSLVPRGGHNILEPAQFGKAILVGPHMENFRDMVQIFRRADALRVISAEELQQHGWPLLANADERNALGARALQVFEAHAGATERTMDALKVLLWMPGTMKDRYHNGAAQ